MTRLLRYSISLVLVATSALLALESVPVASGVAVPAGTFTIMDNPSKATAMAATPSVTPVAASEPTILPAIGNAPLPASPASPPAPKPAVLPIAGPKLVEKDLGFEAKKEEEDKEVVEKDDKKEEEEEEEKAKEAISQQQQHLQGIPKPMPMPMPMSAAAPWDTVNPLTPIHSRPFQQNPSVPRQPGANVFQKRADFSSFGQQQQQQWTGGQQWGGQSQQSQWPGFQQFSQWPGQASTWPGQSSQWPTNLQQSQAWPGSSSTPSPFGVSVGMKKKRAVTPEESFSGKQPTNPSAPLLTTPTPTGGDGFGAMPSAGRLSTSTGGSSGQPSLRNSILCHYDIQNKSTVYCSDGRVYQTSRIPHPGHKSTSTADTSGANETLVKRMAVTTEFQVAPPPRKPSGGGGGPSAPSSPPQVHPVQVIPGRGQQHPQQQQQQQQRLPLMQQQQQRQPPQMQRPARPMEPILTNAMSKPQDQPQHPPASAPAKQNKRAINVDDTVWSQFYSPGQPDLPLHHESGAQKYGGGNDGGGGSGYGQDWNKKEWGHSGGGGGKGDKHWKRQVMGPIGATGSVGVAAGGISGIAGGGVYGPWGIGASAGAGAGVAGVVSGPGGSGVGPGLAAGTRPYSTAIPVPIDVNTLVYPDGNMVLLPPDV